MPRCSCPDFSRTGSPCKHFFAVFEHRNDWKWDALPKSYRENPYLCLDDTIMFGTIQNNDTICEETDDPPFFIPWHTLWKRKPFSPDIREVNNTRSSQMQGGAKTSVMPDLQYWWGGGPERAWKLPTSITWEVFLLPPNRWQGGDHTFYREEKKKCGKCWEKPKKFLSLPVRRKRNPFTNWVGKQASIMHSQYFVHVPVNGNTFTKKSNNKKKSTEKGNKNTTSNQLNRKRKSVHISINKYVQNDCKKRKFEPSQESNDLTIQTKSRASCPQPVINKGQLEPEGSKLNLDLKDLALETEDRPISSGKTQQQGKGLSSNPIVIDETSPYPDYWINCNIDDETTITLYAESKKRIL